MIDVVVVAVYLAAVMAVGLYAGRSTTSLEDYAVAGRSYGSLVVFATMSASFIGGGFSIGNAEKVFLFGIANIVALWGFSLKEILVARFIAPRMDRFPGALSVGDVMATAYGRTGRVASGVFALMLCTGIVGAQVGAIGAVFNVFLGLDLGLGILIGCGIVILYTTIGGMRAVVVTDLFQFVLLAVGIPLLLVLGVISAGGIDAVLAAAPDAHLEIPGDSLTWIGLAALFLSFLLGETLVPPYLQRLLIARDARQAARGTMLAGIFSIPFFAITGLIGLVALALDPALASNLALPHVVVTVMPPVLQGLVIAGVIAVIMSSGDSFLNSAAIAFVNDIARPLSGDRLSARTNLLLARAVTLAIGLLSVVVALTIESVLDILIFAYAYWAPIVLVPLIATIMGRPRHLRNFLAGAAGGLASTLVWNSAFGQPFEIEGLVVGVAVNVALFFGIPSTTQSTSTPSDTTPRGVTLGASRSRSARARA